MSGLNEVELRQIKERVNMALVKSCKVQIRFSPSLVQAEELKKYAVALALQDSIITSESDVLLRELMPQYDLLASDGISSAPGEWVWPAPGAGYNPLGYFADNVDEWVYRGSSNSNKCIIIWGFKILQKPIHITHIEVYALIGEANKIQVGGGKKIEAIDVQEAVTYGDDQYLLPNPVVYHSIEGEKINPHNRVGIRVRTALDARGHTDKIKVMGMVAEPIGLTFTG